MRILPTEHPDAGKIRRQRTEWRLEVMVDVALSITKESEKVSKMGDDSEVRCRVQVKKSQMMA